MLQVHSMRTTTLDLNSPEVIADPYPFFAEERARGDVAWHEPSGMWMTFSHASAAEALRDRRLGRIWKDREPTEYLEPFNLLHRHQMMENEPPDHTRMRRLTGGAFARGHVERLRPRIREIAASLLHGVDPAGFDAIADFAEPLPVLVIAELLGVPAEMAPQLRDWSQAIVRMYEPAIPQATVDAAVNAAREFSDYIRDLANERRARPSNDLLSDLAATDLTEHEVIATAVLLLNAGHEASVNVFGNGLVGLLRSDRRPELDETSVALCVEEMLRFDSAAQLFERTATETVAIAGATIEDGQKIAVLLGAANRDPAVFERPDEFLPARDPNPHLAFGAGIHFCLGAPLARVELAESLAHLLRAMPRQRLAGEPVSRGTFVLRGCKSVPVAAD
jgi:unspecific monooxygenase